MRRAGLQLAHSLGRQPCRTASHSDVLPARLVVASAVPSSSTRHFSSTARHRREITPGQSPWATFVATLREELDKNQQFQESIRQVGGEVGKVQDSETLKRGRQMYERVRLVTSIKENPRLRKAAEELSKAGASVNDAVAEAVKQFEENRAVRLGRDAFRKTAEAAYRASEPIRNTEMYKSTASAVAEALDDFQSEVRYGGYLDKEARRRRRTRRLEALGKTGMATGQRRVKENAEAGTSVQLHETANKESLRERMLSKAPDSVVRFLESASETYRESENPVISGVRGFTSRVGRLFDETESAQVARIFKSLDPHFQQEQFVRELREYIVPEIVDAYVSGDLPQLKKWCSDAAFQMITSGLLPLVQQGLIPDCQVLDIRELDIISAKMLDELPVFLIRWVSQELLAYRNPVTHEVVSGRDGAVQHVTYAAVLTRREEHLDDEITGGWQCVELLRRE